MCVCTLHAKSDSARAHATALPLDGLRAACAILPCARRDARVEQPGQSIRCSRKLAKLPHRAPRAHISPARACASLAPMRLRCVVLNNTRFGFSVFLWRRQRPLRWLQLVGDAGRCAYLSGICAGAGGRVRGLVAKPRIELARLVALADQGLVDVGLWEGKSGQPASAPVNRASERRREGRERTMTPPPAMVALIRVSSSSSPRMASCR